MPGSYIKFGKNNHRGWAAGLGAGFLGSQLALITHGIMDAVTWGMVRPAPLVWGIWGTALAAWLVLVVQHQQQQPAAIIQRRNVKSLSKAAFIQMAAHQPGRHHQPGGALSGSAGR